MGDRLQFSKETTDDIENLRGVKAVLTSISYIIRRLRGVSQLAGVKKCKEHPPGHKVPSTFYSHG